MLLSTRTKEYEEAPMADAEARWAAIKQASDQVRTGGVFVQHATAVTKTSVSAKVLAKKSPSQPAAKRT
jgi:hypothetical protein